MIERYRETLRRYRPSVLDMVEPLGLDRVCELYNIERREADGLVSLKYGIHSPMHTQEARDCRGLIVYADDPTWPVCWPYSKFFNIEEPQAASLDWRSARVLEKLDGSLMLLYFDWREFSWRVASSGHPTAGGPYNDQASSWTFAHAFWDTWRQHDYGFPRTPATPMDDVWFFFELCRPDNRIVVRYDNPRLVLHGGRRRAGGVELSLQELEGYGRLYGWEVVAHSPIDQRNPPQSVKELARGLDPLVSEGYVVVDRYFNRVKVKNPRYVEIHHLRGSRSPRAVVELWKSGEHEGVLAHFPEMRQEFDEVIGPIEHAKTMLEARWHDLWTRCVSDRKEFAAAVKDLPFSTILFRLHTKVFVESGGFASLPEEIDRQMRSLTTQAILRGIGMD